MVSKEGRSPSKASRRGSWLGFAVLLEKGGGRHKGAVPSQGQRAQIELQDSATCVKIEC